MTHCIFTSHFMCTIDIHCGISIS